jgi:hypothetical protein
LKEFIVLDALEVNERMDILVRADAVAGVTSAYPIQMLDGQDGGLMAGNPIFDMKYVIRVENDDSSGDGTNYWKDYVGSYGELLCRTEGSATWTELPNGRRVPIDIDGDEPLSMDLSIGEEDSFQSHSELSCPLLRDPEMSFRPGRISHIPCSVDLQEVFEDDPSVGYKIALTPEGVPNKGLQAAQG